MRFTTLVTLACVAGLAACTTNPYTGQQQASKAATFGAGAAAVCALVAATDSSHRARQAALGCGLAGAGVGYYMDVQEAKLKEQLQGTGVQVAREGNNLRLIMPGEITFPTDSYNVRNDFYPALDSVSSVLSKYPDTTLRITGYTDSTGSRQHNQTLSERRAGSVADYLAARNVDRSRILAQGLGMDQPIADNATAQGRSQNRRVELYILPKTV